MAGVEKAKGRVVRDDMRKIRVRADDTSLTCSLKDVSFSNEQDGKKEPCDMAEQRTSQTSALA